MGDAHPELPDAPSEADLLRLRDDLASALAGSAGAAVPEDAGDGATWLRWDEASPSCVSMALAVDRDGTCRGWLGNDRRAVRVEPGHLTPHGFRECAAWVVLRRRHEGVPETVADEGAERRLGLCARLASLADLRALWLVSRLGQTTYAAVRWFAPGDALADKERFALAFPWLFSEASRQWYYGPPDPDPVVSAGIMISTMSGIGVPEAEAIAVRFRGVRVQNLDGSIDLGHDMRALASVPAHLLPPPLASGADGAEDALAFLLTAMGDLRALSTISGRPVGDVLGRASEPRPYLDRLRRLLPPGEGGAMRTGRFLPDPAAEAVTDMARALSAELLDPAMRIAGGVPLVTDRQGGTYARYAHGRDPALAGAVRLLLGQGTYAALSEKASAWHARVAGISAILADIGGDLVPAGPALFDDLDLGEGLSMTCLRTAPHLAAEGSPGVDGEGMAGLRHCVASYFDGVARGHVAIVGIRRTLPDGRRERVSTAEVRFRATGPVVVQHRARGNAEPPVEARAALARGLAIVGPEATRRVVAHVGSCPEVLSWGEMIVRRDAWERVRDAWAFALTRPQRAMSPAELLAEAGLPIPPEGARAWRAGTLARA